ncbi:MAG: caspase family protein [Rhizobiales bacterium]|nr:caspase family protein [Hyphomicrobiales bacterium]
MSRTGRALNLVTAIVAALWFAHSPAAAQASSRLIETVGVAGARTQVASADTAAPAPRTGFNLAQATGPERRIALVIGNSKYEAAKPLPNPANDAEAVSELFNQAGFEVVKAFDLNRELMRQVIGEFAARVAEKGPNSVALVYYAGHGLQVDGDNYLVPVDARFEKESDVPEQGVRLADLMATLESVPSKIRIVILDACRNNPFSTLNNVAGKGLAIVDAPSGSIVAYSTAPGTEAFDGQGRYSPYAAAFMRTAKTPNLPIEQVFKKVRGLVDDISGSKQMPWESTSLISDFVFFTNADAAAAAPVPVKVALADLSTRSVRDAYQVVVEEDSVEYYEEFVRLYPRDPLCDYIRRTLLRRLQMIAWHKATKSNNAAAYAAFLAKHGNSDLAKAAKKLQEQPKLVSLTKFDVKIGKTAPVIPFQRNGQNGNGLGIKTGNLNGQNRIGTSINTNINTNTSTGITNGNLNGQTGKTIKPGTVIPAAPNGQNGLGIKTGTVIPATNTVIPATNNGQTGQTGKNSTGIKVGNLPTNGAGNVTTLSNTNAGNTVLKNGQTTPKVLNNGSITPKVLDKPVRIDRQVNIQNQINVQPKVIQNQNFNRQR